MRVLLIANFQPDVQMSMSLYAEWVKKVLESYGHEVTTLRPKPLFARISKYRSITKYLGYLDKFILFPPRLAKIAKEYDLIHVLDHSNSMYLRVVGPKAKLITCHDLLAVRAARGEFPEVSTGWSGRLLQRWILSSLRTADYAICVSEATAADLRRLTEEASSKKRVIYHSLNWNYRPGVNLSGELVSKLGLLPDQPYLLHVGGNSWYKNRVGVLRIFAHFAEMPENVNYRLLMVGPSLTKEMVLFIRRNGLSSRVMAAENISGSELAELYCNASALLFPSLEEGFGWPIIEAQACGCLVATTNRRPMTEIAGDAAILINPADPETAARKISIEIRNGDAMRTAGFKNLERFNQALVAAQYMEVYDDVVTQHGSRNGTRVTRS